MKALFDFMRYLLETPEANSRFVFLIQGIASAIVIVMTGAAYIFIKDPTQREGYVTMMATLIGGGSLLHVGRMLSKKKMKPPVSEEKK